MQIISRKSWSECFINIACGTINSRFIMLYDYYTEPILYKLGQVRSSHNGCARCTTLSIEGLFVYPLLCKGLTSDFLWELNKVTNLDLLLACKNPCFHASVLMQDGVHYIATMMHVTCKEECNKNEAVIINSAIKLLQCQLKEKSWVIVVRVM